MAMKTVRWGMIGCGDVTEMKSGPGFYKADHSELFAVMRRDGDLARDYARRHVVKHASDDARAILDAPEVDVVYIATPTVSHCEYTLLCAEAGKHVYVEKPMAMSHSQSVQMIAACDERGVRLWVGYYRRALPRFIKLKELIDDGAIGEVRAVTSHQLGRLPEITHGASMPWRIDPAISGGAYFFEGACHTLDILDFLFGPIATVRSIVANQGRAYAAEDLVAASYQFNSGVCGSGLWCYTSEEESEMNEVIGSRGRLQFSTTRPVPIRLFRGGKVEEIAIPDPIHVHQPLIQAIVDEINGGQIAPSTGVTAARTAWAMDQILNEFRTVGRLTSLT